MERAWIRDVLKGERGANTTAYLVKIPRKAFRGIVSRGHHRARVSKGGKEGSLRLSFYPHGMAGGKGFRY